MKRSMIQNWSVCFLAAAFAFAGCTSDQTSGESTGSLDLSLELAPGIVINEVTWTITGGDMPGPMSGTIDTSAPGSTASVEVFGLAPADDYVVTLEAIDETGTVSCKGDMGFAITEPGETATAMVMLNCKVPSGLGAVRVNGEFNICAELAKVIVSPLQTSVGNDITLQSEAKDVEGDDIEVEWTATGGTLGDATAANTTFTCTEVGDYMIDVTVSDDDFQVCTHSLPTPVMVTCVDGDGGGEGGSGGDDGGMGGSGGDPMGTATVTAAHFAPEVPSAENTAVAIFVDGVRVDALGTIEYGQVLSRVPLDAPGTYLIGVGAPDGDQPLLEEEVTLEIGDDKALAAYRVGLFEFDMSTDDLAGTDGRVSVGHGADDEALNPVDIINTDACPDPLLDDLPYEANVGPLDLAAMTYNLGFDLKPGDCTAEVPFAAPVTAGLFTALVAVDEDTSAGLDPQVWALVAFAPPEAVQAVALIEDQDDGELTTNGDFETGDFTGWTNFCDNGDGSCTVISDNPNGGDFAARVSQPTPAQNAVIKQERIAAGEVATGDTIDVELFIRGSVGPGGVVFLELFSENTGGGVDNEGLRGPFFPTDDWVQISESFTLAGSPGDGITVQIAGITSGDAGSFVDLYVDDVSAKVAP